MRLSIAIALLASSLAISTVHGQSANPATSKSKVATHTVVVHKIAKSAPKALPADEFSLSSSASGAHTDLPRLAAPAAPAQDSALSLGLRWSAENDPDTNAATSTVQGIDQIKRDSGQAPGESGSSVEGGVNLKF
jgi:hypothetical protein